MGSENYTVITPFIEISVIEAVSYLVSIVILVLLKSFLEPEWLKLREPSLGLTTLSVKEYYLDDN